VTMSVPRWTAWTLSAKRASPFRVPRLSAIGMLNLLSLAKRRSLPSTLLIPLVRSTLSCFHIIPSLSQGTLTSPLRSSVRYGSWMARSWFSVRFLVSRFVRRYQRRIVLDSDVDIQSQTITVDRQMRRYNVPRVSFINKMDRCASFSFFSS